MRKRLAVVVLFAVMIMMFAVPVAADTYRYVALDSQSGTWITQKKHYWNSDYTVCTSYVYKVVVPATGYLRINIANAQEYDTIEIKRKRGQEEPDGYYESGGRYGVDKGTYYIYADEGQKFKYTYTKAPAGSNFSRAKATVLAKNTRKHIAQTPAYNFSRWYKARITAKQRINITMNGAFRVLLVTQTGKAVQMSSVNTSTGKRFSSKNVLAAGNYYIVVLRANEEYTYGDYNTYMEEYLGGDISWK